MHAYIRERRGLGWVRSSREKSSSSSSSSSKESGLGFLLFFRGDGVSCVRSPWGVGSSFIFGRGIPWGIPGGTRGRWCELVVEAARPARCGAVVGIETGGRHRVRARRRHERVDCKDSRDMRLMGGLRDGVGRRASSDGKVGLRVSGVRAAVCPALPCGGVSYACNESTRGRADIPGTYCVPRRGLRPWWRYHFTNGEEWTGLAAMTLGSGLLLS